MMFAEDLVIKVLKRGGRDIIKFSGLNHGVLPGGADEAFFLV